ncbi:MAG: adenosylmethionine-8-amino-7-oxononanoate aminotransferase [Mariprofundus sp.]|nr:adenosylmethionine-8-amino-7-oxononanoate aminotransferase [Mariprofundus sp.]
MKQNSAKNMLLPTLLAGLLALNACAYHLVGHGGGDSGAIPADVQTLSISGNAEATLLSRLRQRLHSEQYVIVEPGSTTDPLHHASVRINMTRLVFTPSTFDINGVATQYRMILGGSILIEHNNKTVWQSGLIQRQGDVFVTGGPASIESSKKRLQKDLRKQWISDAVGRMRSGF